MGNSLNIILMLPLLICAVIYCVIALFVAIIMIISQPVLIVVPIVIVMFSVGFIRWMDS